MAEETQQDGQKTLVAFIVGLLIGGMLVWAFSGPSADAPASMSPADEASEDVTGTNNDSDAESETSDVTDSMGDKGGSAEVVTPAPTLEVGDGAIRVSDQPASRSVAIDSAVYPVSEGWVGVREYNNEQLGYILGVVRFSESQGLVPTEIVLQRSTTPGNTYAVVVYTEDGDFDFSLAGDVQIDKVFDTFKAE
jgi:hypothetical protein